MGLIQTQIPLETNEIDTFKIFIYLWDVGSTNLLNVRYFWTEGKLRAFNKILSCKNKNQNALQNFLNQTIIIRAILNSYFYFYNIFGRFIHFLRQNILLIILQGLKALDKKESLLWNRL